MRKRAILRLSLISPCRYKTQGSLTSQPVAFMSAWSTILLGLCQQRRFGLCEEGNCRYVGVFAIGYYDSAR